MPDTAVAQDALKYQGKGYVFGGAPAKGLGNWDCSSFINWVVGHDLGMAIPGFSAGTYTGDSHGPVVLDWATWSGATTTNAPGPGDLCIWPGAGALGHIGIYLSSNQMISALNSNLGTITSGIQGNGPMGVALIYRSLNGGSGAGVSVPGCLLGVMMSALQHKAQWGRYV